MIIFRSKSECVAEHRRRNSQCAEGEGSCSWRERRTEGKKEQTHSSQSAESATHSQSFWEYGQCFGKISIIYHTLETNERYDFLFNSF